MFQPRLGPRYEFYLEHNRRAGGIRTNVNPNFSVIIIIDYYIKSLHASSILICRCGAVCLLHKTLLYFYDYLVTTFRNDLQKTSNLSRFSVQLSV